MGLVNHDVIRATRGERYIYTVQFDTNSTSAPDGVVPDLGTDQVVARTGVGDFTITFAGDKAPLTLDYASASVLGDEPTLSAKVTGYVASTGVLSVTVYSDPDTGTGGQPAQADTTDKTVQVFCVFTRNSRL